MGIHDDDFLYQSDAQEKRGRIKRRILVGFGMFLLLAFFVALGWLAEGWVGVS